ncbi:hypothetical protein [Halodesulfovibrio spirochaetisodalis]|uniref:Transcription factor zinc-finger domain-containing protein n=1 Tax=Halodesulfovibrio spirochaetisodalis TaxID=1560234 RepID=A0A1B7XAU1_9BACT|nr:hypothetical protein [Halodesulfovibrio spirochaetisodalis]OBQ46491.1 hypothetical protein SP90_12390 [Halodesulfovibrio spirochaetisodalis]
MIKYIETDEYKQIYCPDFHDGRIQKVFLKKIQQEIYVCEECESLWFTLEGIFLERGDFFTGFLKDKGQITKDGFDDWNSILEYRDFVTFDEIKEIVDKHKIKVVVLE